MKLRRKNSHLFYLRNGAAIVGFHIIHEGETKIEAFQNLPAIYILIPFKSIVFCVAAVWINVQTFCSLTHIIYIMLHQLFTVYWSAFLELFSVVNGTSLFWNIARIRNTLSCPILKAWKWFIYVTSISTISTVTIIFSNFFVRVN